MTNDLLRRYVCDRSEAAFAELVRQHIDLVYSAALRQVGGDTAAAEDVTQLVFTDLARKAPGLTRHTSLTGWLYTSTRYRAAHARRAEQRRRNHEREAHEMNQLLQSTDPDPRWQELRPLLDDAMHDLSATDREAVLLRYFERLPLAEIGARLGLKENAARMKVDRAIDRLRAALAKRGVTSTITALAGLLNARAMGTAPAGLAARASSSATAAAAATGGLTWALLKLAGLMKGNALLATGAAVLVAGFIVVPKWLPTATTATAPASAASTREKTAALTPSSPGQALAAYPARVAAARTTDSITLRIIADDTEKPVAGAAIEYSVAERGGRRSPLSTPLTATEEGVCVVPVSRATVGLLAIQSRTDGFVETSAVWSPDRGESIPQQYTWRLGRSVPIGGQVLDEQGKPVSGAEVQVQLAIVTQEQLSQQRSSETPHLSLITREKCVADVDGRWRIDRFANESISTLFIWPTHPDYFTEPIITYSGGNPEAAKQLVAGTHVLKLTRGITAQGLVVDTEGHPVPGVKVEAFADIDQESLRPQLAKGQGYTINRLDRIGTTNLHDGTFVLTGCRPGTNLFRAEARGFALVNQLITLTNNPASLRLVLNRGHVLRLRVLDANGLPVTNNLQVVPSSLEPGGGGLTAARSVRGFGSGPNFGRGSGYVPLGSRGLRGLSPDAEGRVVWESSPDSELRLDLLAFGIPSTNMIMPADGQEHLVMLASAGQTAPTHLSVKGNVRDAATGQPIGRFLVHTGRFTSTNANFRPGWISNKGFQGGTFVYDQRVGAGQKFSVRFKIEADGYAPFVTREVVPDESDVQLDIALSPAPSTSVTVLSRDGQPAANADIGLEMPYEPLTPKPGGLTHAYPGNYTNVFLTDERGRFVLPPDDSITRVVAACPDGYAEATPAALVAEPTMRLQPWGRIVGTYLSNGKPATGRKLTLYSVTPSEPSVLCSDFLVETDASGHFVVPQVPSGQFRLTHIETLNLGGYRRAGNWIEIPTTVRLGETTTVSFQCCTVTAHLRWPAGVNRDTNWWVNMWASRPASTEQSAAIFTFKEGDDGTWMIEDVTPGNYTVGANVSLRGPVGTLDKPFFRAETTLVIPQGVSDGAKDAGELMLQPVP